MSRADFIKLWPIVAVAAASCVGYGTLRANVEELKEKQAVAASDHDAIVRIETEQKAIKESVSEIKDSVKEIARAVRRSERATPSR